MATLTSFPTTDASVAPDAPLTDAYRLLRRVAPPEAPFAGWLAHARDDETVLLVATGELGDWPAIGAEAGGHVLAPRDLVRVAGGVRIELDWCGERLDRLLDRREQAGARLGGGEAVTLAVSIRRGLAEIAAIRPRGTAAWPAGEWWLTDAARPVFVHDSAGGMADADARTLLLRIAGLTDASTVRAAIVTLADAGATEGDEAALFAAAEPLPVATVVFEPARVRSLDIAAGLPPAVEVSTRRGRAARVMEQHVDADLSAVVSDAVHSVARRLRGRRPKPWILAAGVATLVLAAGALWPVGADQPATAGGSSSARPTATSTPSPATSTPVPSPKSAAPVDAATIAATLLNERRRCAGAESCLAAVVEDPRVDWAAGPIDLADDERSVTLLDEFGGVAVLRVTATDGEAAAQLVVIVESDGRWLLRDVHDVMQK